MIVPIKYIRIAVCSLLILQYCFSIAQPRTETGLNQYWSFTKGNYEPGAAPDRSITWETVSLPHTWNKDDVNDDIPGYYRGIGWYRKSLTIGSNLKGKNIYLYFEGANQQATVYVNGKKAGTHIGGYTGFTVQIDPYLNFDTPGKNEIAVSVDNSYNENIPPLTADFTFYGGIYRNVKLITSNKVHFDLNDGGCGVYITTPEVSAAKAMVKVKGNIVKYAGFNKKLTVNTKIVDASGKTISSKMLTLAKDKLTQSILDEDVIDILNPHLWSVDDPYLYHVITQLYDADTRELLDEVTSPLGFRWFKFDAEKGFFLNGKPLKLVGASRHQDFEGLGNALPDGYHEADMKLLKAMGGNFLRIAHYPQSPEVLSACDRLGILASVEIPIVNGITETEAFTNNSKQMLLEMLHQNYNHPALIMWAYMNEIMLRPKYNDDAVKQQSYGANVNELAQLLENILRKEDPARYTMMACHGNYAAYNKPGLLHIPMIVGWNLYQGWYGGTTSEFGKFLDKFHQDYPNTPTLVTEYGADADPRIRSEVPIKFDKSIDYALNFHKVYLDAIKTRSFIAGAMAWNLADFNSEARDETMPHINNKGLLTWSRQPKDTYRFYQANLLKTPFIKLSNWNNRAGIADSANNQVCTQAITVFTNAELVKLYLNGNTVGEAKADNGMAVFNVPFINGINTLQATAVIDGKQYADNSEITFELIPFDMQLSTSKFESINILLGATRVYVQPGINQVWVPGKAYKKGRFGYIGGKTYIGNNNRLPYGTDRNINNTANDPIYQTQQVGLTAYKIDVPKGEYQLTLHFAELVSGIKKETLAYNLSTGTAADEKTGERIFDVLINGNVVLKDFDVAKKYGYLTAGFEQFKVSANDDNGLNIEFKAIKGEPILNALQIKKVN